MPLTTKELLRLAEISPQTLKRWKRKTGVRNSLRGVWTVPEILALRRGMCRALGQCKNHSKP